jgi:hypothetical protein
MSILWRGVRFVAAVKQPNFIALQSAVFQVAKRTIFVFRAKIAHFNQQFNYAMNGNINQVNRGMDTAFIRRTAKNLNSFFGVRFIHRECMLAQASNINKV